MTISNLRFAIVRIAREAALFSQKSGAGVIREKAFQDLVSDLDITLEKRIVSQLRKLTPELPVYGEESISDRLKIDTECWIVDPLDGTGNFVARLPFSAVSIARLDADCNTLDAAVADIASGVVYSASVGEGAWLDDEPLRIGESSPALIALSSGALDLLQHHSTLYQSIRDNGKIRNFGAQSLHLCFVAAGKLGFAASYEAKLWDDAAGRLIATEAGACYLSFAPLDTRCDPFAEQLSLCAAPDRVETVSDLFSKLFCAT